MPWTTVLVFLVLSWSAVCAKVGDFCYPFKGKCHGNLGQFVSRILLHEPRTPDSQLVDFDVADWDHDGDLDLVLVNLVPYNSSFLRSNLRFFENTAGNLSERVGPSNPFENIFAHYTQSWLGHPRLLKLVDWDGDGDTDLILVSGDLLNSETEMRYYQQMSGQLVELTGVENPFHAIRASGFETADWDGDGDEDAGFLIWGL